MSIINLIISWYTMIVRLWYSHGMRALPSVTKACNVSCGQEHISSSHPVLISSYIITIFHFECLVRWDVCLCDDRSPYHEDDPSRAWYHNGVACMLCMLILSQDSWPLINLSPLLDDARSRLASYLFRRGGSIIYDHAWALGLIKSVRRGDGGGACLPSRPPPMPRLSLPCSHAPVASAALEPSTKKTLFVLYAALTQAQHEGEKERGLLGSRITKI